MEMLLLVNSESNCSEVLILTGLDLMLGDGNVIVLTFGSNPLSGNFDWLYWTYFYIPWKQGTVEERMEAVQARKQKMISGALTDQEVRSARIEELKMLFS